MQRILVTGAAGFIGFHLARYLVDRGHRVTIVDNFCRGERDQLYQDLCREPRVEALELDLSDLGQLDRIGGSFDAIFHMAALNGTQNFYEAPWDVLWNSTVPTLNLLRRFVVDEARTAKFIYAGTSEVYAGAVDLFGWPVPTGEDVPAVIPDSRQPRWSYAVAKLHGEAAVAHSCRLRDVPFLIIRYHNAYGPRMGDKHVIPDFIARMLEGRFELYGATNTRSFCYIDDAVAATVALSEREEAFGRIINVGGSEELTMEELGHRILAVAGRSEHIQAHEAPPGSVARRSPKLDTAKSLIGNFETVDLKAGLDRTLRYYREQAS